jgi:hypothetical protein
MPETLRVVKGIVSWIWTQRTKILVLILVMTLVAPQPAKGQFIDVAAIVAAIGAINTAITNVIGAGLRDISGALNAVNGVLNAIQSFFQSTIYPLDAINRARGVVRLWFSVLKERSFSTPEEWLFANPATGRPYHQEEIQKKHIRKAGVAAGIGGDIGWHTFRHSYRSWLDETGAPLTVQKELMRHASIQTTMNIYGKAMTDSKRQAHRKVVEMVLKSSKPEKTADHKKPVAAIGS